MAQLKVDHRRGLARVLAAAVALALLAAGLLLWLRSGRGSTLPVPDLTPAFAASAEPVPVEATPAADRDTRIQRINQALAVAPVTFGPQGNQLTAAGRQNLTLAVGLLKAAPDLPVRLVGHSAPVPTDPAIAQRVAQSRAEVVAAALRADGIAADRLTVLAVGDTQPLASSEASRRVEISVG